LTFVQYLYIWAQKEATDMGKANNTKVPAHVLNRKDLTGPALRTFFRIADAWGLNEAEQMRLLGLEKRSTLQSWKRGVIASLSKDALERISYVMGIYKGLNILLPKTADQWVRKPNMARIFAGGSAIDRMMSGNVADLYVVRQYVDAQRG
jgi:hypothetical protein